MADAQMIIRQDGAFVGQADVVLAIISRLEIERLIGPSGIQLEHVDGLAGAIDRDPKQSVIHFDLISDYIAQINSCQRKSGVVGRIDALLRERLDDAVVIAQFEQRIRRLVEPMNLSDKGPFGAWNLRHFA